nr:hypothetical protein [Desulfobacula sp.]
MKIMINKRIELQDHDHDHDHDPDDPMEKENCHDNTGRILHHPPAQTENPRPV